jgi:hypothetical protein
MSAQTSLELLPGGLRTPSSLFVLGTNRPLLKWVALALLEPHASRTYWTDVRLEGEAIETTDPVALHAIPTERLLVAHPRDLQGDESDALRAEAATATMIRSDEPPESLRQITEFLRLPPHTQERISSTTAGPQPPVLVVSMAHRLVGLYSSDRVPSMIRAVKNSGTSIVVLWADAAPMQREIFDVVLHVEGADPSRWRDATLRCEKGITDPPLGSGAARCLSDLPQIASVLDRSIPR